jgi:hypothetical protein
MNDTRPADLQDEALEMLQAMRPEGNVESLSMFIRGRTDGCLNLHVEREEFFRILEWAKRRYSSTRQN